MELSCEQLKKLMQDILLVCCINYTSYDYHTISITYGIVICLINILKYLFCMHVIFDVDLCIFVHYIIINLYLSTRMYGITNRNHSKPFDFMLN